MATAWLPFQNHISKYASVFDLLQVGIWSVIVLTFLWGVKKRHASKTSGLPIPGLRYPKFSVIGSAYTLPSSSVMKRLSLPVTAFIIQNITGHAKLFEKEKLFYYDIGNRRFVALCKPEAVEELLRSNSLLEKGWTYRFMLPWLGTGLLTSSGSKWRSRRKLLTPSFHFDILKDFVTVIDDQSRILVDVLKKNVVEEFVDIIKLITLCSLDIICESTLGVHVGAQKNSKSEYVQAVLRAAQTIMDRAYRPDLWLDALFRMSAMGRQFTKDVNTLHAFTRKVIHQKKAAWEHAEKQEETNGISYSEPRRKRKALMDLLIDHQMKHKDITEEDIREEIDTFAFEGHDTTSMGMSWALYLIGLYPEVQEKLRDELNSIYGNDAERCVVWDDLKDMKYLECVLKESQRLYPSVPMFGREVEQDMDFCGYRVKKGDTLVVYAYGVHRSPEVFTDPEKFDPERFLPENSLNRHPFSYVPFSAGPRNCIVIIQSITGHAKLFEKEKIFYYDIGNRRFIVLCRPESVEELLRSNTLLVKGWTYRFLLPWLGTGLLTSGGSKWRSRRKLLTPSFHFDILKDFVTVIEEQSRILVDVLKKNIKEESVDIVKLITLCSLDIICESTLGVHVGAQKNCKSEYVQAVLRAAQTVMERMYRVDIWLDAVFRMSAIGRQFTKDLNTLHTFTRKVIQQKKAALERMDGKEEPTDVSYSEPRRKRKALMDLLLEHQMQHQDITEEDIREEIDTFAFEGHDTTSMGMSWALYLIGLYPEVQEKIHEELNSIYRDDTERCVVWDDLKDMKYLECVLKESQRLYPSVPMFGREATEDMDFCGYRIKKGDTLTVYTYGLHRNPQVFPNPEKFDPDRFLPENSQSRHPFSYVPFSAGPRNCIGQRFAMLEEKIVLANVLRNFHVKSLDQRDEVVLMAELILRPAFPLRLKFTPLNFTAGDAS